MNNFNDQEFGNKIKSLLDEGIRDLGDSPLDRLKAARELALTHRKLPAAVFSLAWAGDKLGEVPMFNPRYLLPVAALIIGALSINIIQQNQSVSEIEEIDASLLAGDLPINAYLDKGFDAWLKRTAQQ